MVGSAGKGPPPPCTSVVLMRSEGMACFSSPPVSESATWVRWLMSSDCWRPARAWARRSSSARKLSTAMDRPREDLDQGAGHLDADGSDHDALDPLLGLGDRAGVDRGHLPEEGQDKCQGADRAHQGLADRGPGGDQVDDGRDGRGDARLGGKEEVHGAAPPGGWCRRVSA